MKTIEISTNLFPTGVVTMYPVNTGEIKPGSVAKVFEYPTIILANCGAISSGFAKYPEIEKAPRPTDKVMQMMIWVVSVKYAANSRKIISAKNERLLKYFLTCVVDKKFFI